MHRSVCGPVEVEFKDGRLRVGIRTVSTDQEQLVEFLEMLVIESQENAFSVYERLREIESVESKQLLARRSRSTMRKRRRRCGSD